MMIEQLESRLAQLNIETKDAQALLALPLVSVLSVDQQIREREQDEIEAFCRQRLAFSESQLGIVRDWIAYPPSHQYVDEAHQLLEALHLARDELTVSNRALEKVMIRAEKMLRNRIIQGATPVFLAQQLLECFCHRFGIDLGTPWQNLVPEAFDSNGMLHSESGVRKKIPLENFSQDVPHRRGPAF